MQTKDFETEIESSVANFGQMITFRMNYSKEKFIFIFFYYYYFVLHKFYRFAHQESVNEGNCCVMTCKQILTNIRVRRHKTSCNFLRISFSQCVYSKIKDQTSPIVNMPKDEQH